MADAHRNFAYSTIRGTNQGDTTNPGTGTTLTVQAGDGLKFPPPPFNATVWPSGTQPISTNAEIIRVTDIDVDTFTILRTQESSSSQSFQVGFQIAATITEKTMTDASAPLTYWAPVHIAGAGQTGLQTIAANYTSVTGTNSLFVFPVTIPPNLNFNQILIGNSLSLATSAIGAASHTHFSYFGLYSRNDNSLSLITSNSFGISQTLNSRSVTWNFPTTTMTSGYGYGPFNTNGSTGLTTTGLMSSFISGTRIIGLQFGADMTSLTGGVYWIGLLQLRSNGDTRSTFGLSNAGIIGQPINPVNMVSGSLMPIGVASTAWSASNSAFTNWWGRNIVGFLTNTGRAGFGGTAIPTAITISELGTTGGAGSTATILPAVTFVST